MINRKRSRTAMFNVKPRLPIDVRDGISEEAIASIRRRKLQFSVLNGLQKTEACILL